MAAPGAPFSCILTWENESGIHRLRMDGAGNPEMAQRLCRIWALQQGCPCVATATVRTFPDIRTAHARWRRRTGRR